MNKHTARRKRHRANQIVKNKNGVRKHTKKGGRTGHVQAKRTPGKFNYRSWRPNPPDPTNHLGF